MGQVGPWLLSALAMLLATLAYWNSPEDSRSSAPRQAAGIIQTIDKKGILRAGYGVFPPYSQEDPSTGKVSGVAVDIVEEIARQIGAKVEWKRFNWNTMAADLKRGEYDVLADAVFQTPARGREFLFTEPYAYFAIGIGVVKRGDNRFANFDEINDPSITVAVGQGFAEETFVKARAPEAKLLSIPSSADTALPINAVVAGRADIAVVNLEDAKRFVGANPADLRIIWDDNPPAYVPAGFALRFSDFAGKQFLDVALRNLRTTGVLQSIARRHNVESNLTPGGK